MTGAVIACGATGDIHAITISDATVSKITVSPTAATATYSLQNDGDIESHAGDIGDWITPKDSFSDYECQMAVVSGSLTSGTTGSYLGLGTTRTWTLTQSVIGTSQFVGTLTIRRASDLTVLDTATITINAEMTI